MDLKPQWQPQKHNAARYAAAPVQPRVHAAAEYVTDNVDDDGVEKALRHFGLINEDITQGKSPVQSTGSFPAHAIRFAWLKR